MPKDLDQSNSNNQAKQRKTMSHLSKIYKVCRALVIVTSTLGIAAAIAFGDMMSFAVHACILCVVVFAD